MGINMSKSLRGGEETELSINKRVAEKLGISVMCSEDGYLHYSGDIDRRFDPCNDMGFVAKLMMDYDISVSRLHSEGFVGYHSLASRYHPFDEENLCAEDPKFHSKYTVAALLTFLEVG